MLMNDPLGDMLTRIRNAQLRKRPTVATPARATAYSPKAQKASRGVATTARTNSRLAAILHWGRARCSGLVPGR